MKQENSPAQCVKRALEAIRHEMSIAKGSERAILELFSEEIGSEVDGWDMRIRELEE